MTIARINSFTANAGSGDQLHERLASFADTIRSSFGCHEVSVLRATDDPNKVVIYEVWDSVDEHLAAAQAIPPDAVQSVVALLAEPPAGEYFDIT